VIAVQEVPYDHLSRYGIVKGTECGKHLLLLDDIVEKPRPEVYRLMRVRVDTAEQHSSGLLGG
jgi:UTP-glucose-1-phosphate uridylyltransferase